MGNALDLAIISLLGGIVVGLIGFYLVRSSVRLDRLDSKIDDRFEQLNGRFEELDGRFEELDKKMDAKFEHFKVAIISALVNHTHPEAGGPPVFTAPPPTVYPPPAAPEPEPAPAADD